MKVEFLRSFERDLRGLNDPAMKRRLLKLIDDLERSDTLEGLGNVKRLVGHRHAYRIRLGNYRVGLFLINGTVELARFVHRRDIYRVFP
jgi:mRNA interferase RelE/StbE